MSNTLAIAATTSTLRNLLLDGVPKRDSALADLDVTTRTPDAARKNVDGTSLNLFLYRTVVNAGWSNLDPPRAVHPGETGQPPLALDLHYLVTAFGRDAVDQDALSHRILGGAMSVLHDHPVLGAAEIRTALAGNDLADQVERIRITPLPLSVDDMSKLWSTFQSQYRLSAAYEVSVVLIESTRPARAPLPVLSRGQDDRGVTAVAGGAPILRAVVPVRSQAAARLGEDVLVDGDDVADPTTTFRFDSLVPRQIPVVELQRRAPLPGEPPDQVWVRLRPLAEDPDALGRWVPGFYSVSAAADRPDLPTLTSGSVALAVAPRITVTPNAGDAGSVPVGGTLTVTCAPRARKVQVVRLLLGGHQLVPTSFVNPVPGSPGFQQTPTSLTFEVPSVPAGVHTVRLRVDGVDSLPVTFPDVGPPTFDPAQQVRVA